MQIDQTNSNKNSETSGRKNQFSVLLAGTSTCTVLACKTRKKQWSERAFLWKIIENYHDNLLCLLSKLKATRNIARERHSDTQQSRERPTKRREKLMTKAL